MQNNIIVDIKRFLEREGSVEEAEDEFTALSDKLHNILSTEGDQQQSKVAAAITMFLDANETKKRKLLSFCFDFCDPTVHAEPILQGEQICQHAFLKQDELYMLHQFVKRHQNDLSFGETVYKIMDRHGMTAPQVYKNALLRRQDFARVTDPRCKNVTRKMTWQIIIGLRCTLEEADDVLFSAGYIRRNTRMDLTMQYFIERNNYDIEAIDAVLADLGLKTFTCE